MNDGASGGKAEPRPTDLHLYAIIGKTGFQNASDDSAAASKLIAFLQTNATPALLSYAFKGRTKLTALIDDVRFCEEVDGFLVHKGNCRFEELQASQMPCSRSGTWLPCALEALKRCAALRLGAMVSTPPPCAGIFAFVPGRSPAKAGPSFLHLCGPCMVLSTYKPHRSVGLDWCFDEAVLSLPTQLLWCEGKPCLCPGRRAVASTMSTCCSRVLPCPAPVTGSRAGCACAGHPLQAHHVAVATADLQLHAAFANFHGPH